MERRLNILVVDDEQIVLDSVKKLLRKDNYEVLTVLDALSAVEMIKENGVDIILTDLMMPEMDGLELMQAVRENYPNLPIIMITGYATINTALQAMQLGAFDYVAKPFSKAEIKGVVKRAAERVFAIDNAEISGKPDDLQDLSEKAAMAVSDIGSNTWLMSEEEGVVILGVEHPFLNIIGRIQTVHLAAPGEILRQGSVFAQFFTTDLRAHSLLSPLSGKVLEMNENSVKDPTTILDDPYGEGWLIRISPTNFEAERKILGL